MSKKRNKRNNKSSLKALKQKRKAYQAGGIYGGYLPKFTPEQLEAMKKGKKEAASAATPVTSDAITFAGSNATPKPNLERQATDRRSAVATDTQQTSVPGSISPLQPAKEPYSDTISPYLGGERSPGQFPTGGTAEQEKLRDDFYSNPGRPSNRRLEQQQRNADRQPTTPTAEQLAAAQAAAQQAQQAAASVYSGAGGTYNTGAGGTYNTRRGNEGRFVPPNQDRATNTPREGGDDSPLPEDPYDRGPLNVEKRRPPEVDLDDPKLVMKSTPIDREGTITGADDIQQLDPAGEIKAKKITTESKAAVAAPLSGGTAGEAGLSTYDAEMAKGLAPTEAAQGKVSKKAVAKPGEIRELTERAKAATRDEAQERAAKQKDPRELIASPESYVDKVTGKTVKVSPTPEAEAATRNLILGTEADDSEAAQIIKTVGFEAAQRRTVTGTAAKSAATNMLVVVGDLPPDITASIVEDPASVTAQIDSEPVEVRAAIAALPTEALVSSQMENLLAGIDEDETPIWARPAVQKVNDMLTQRGLSASSVGRDALFNSIIQSAMPMAQSNAQALQATAAQNLSNQQQASMAEATQSMQLRLANLSNRQTAESQSAQMAQQMKTMQSQFSQDAVMTTAQMQQQTRTQNYSNRQQAAQMDAQNTQSMAAQNLGNEQQIELADMQYMNATESENMSAIQQERMAEMQVAADFLSKNAGFKQQMELANLGNDQQMRLANLSSRNQQSSETLSAEQQTELANLNTRMQTNLTQAKIAESMGVAQLNVDQQRAVTNATMNANLDLTRFSADQQVAVANSKFMQSMTVTSFNARQQEAMQNATALATMDMAAVDQRTKLAISNAQSFLSMDMANLSNRQQGVIVDQQAAQQRLLSDQAATNASRQFNATSANQVDQFNASLAAQMQQFNATQANAMAKFNAEAANKRAAEEQAMQMQADIATEQMNLDAQKFNEQSDLQRDQWNAANAQAVEQSNVQWRRQANTAETAATNEANRQNVQNAFALTSSEQAQLWQQERDEAQYIRAAYESQEGRKATLLAAALGNEGVYYKGRGGTTDSLVDIVEGLYPEAT